MRKIIIYFFSAVMLLGITSCKDDDKYLFGEGPDERLQKQLIAYQDLLCNAPNGWMVMVGTQNTGANGGAYRLFMQFTQDNRVTMYSDKDATQAVTPKTSSYRMKAMQAPTLMFDTYSYLHDLANPLGEVSGGNTGDGLLSDFDFNLINEPAGDEIVAIGRKNACPVIMRKATAEEAAAITGGAPLLREVITETAANWAPIKYATVDINGFFVQLTVGTRRSILTYRDTSGEIISANVSSYAEFNQDIRLMEPFDYEGVKFDKLIWDGTKYSAAVSGSNYEVYDNMVPFYPFDFGYGKTYSKITVNKSVLNTAGGKSLVDPFLTDVYDVMYNSIAGLPRYLSQFVVSFTMDGATGIPQMRLTCTYTNAGGTTYLADAYYDIRMEDDGTVYFINMRRTDGNMNTIGPRMATNLLSYFLYEGTGITGGGDGITVPASGNKFRLDWAPNNTPGLAKTLGGLYVVGSDPVNYLAGELSR